MKTLVLLAIPGGMEWVLIAIVVLLLFGGKKIPELMKGLGKGISEFKKGKKDFLEDHNKTLHTTSDVIAVGPNLILLHVLLGGRIQVWGRRCFPSG